MKNWSQGQESMLHIFNLSTWKAKEDCPECKGSLGYNSKTLSQNKYSSKVAKAIQNKIKSQLSEPTRAHAGNCKAFWNMKKGRRENTSDT